MEKLGPYLYFSLSILLVLVDAFFGDFEFQYKTIHIWIHHHFSNFFQSGPLSYMFPT